MNTDNPTESDVEDVATRVLGSRDLAMEWLSRPTFALDNHRPQDLLVSAEGRATLVLLLLRIEHGVYT